MICILFFTFFCAIENRLHGSWHAHVYPGSRQKSDERIAKTIDYYEAHRKGYNIVKFHDLFAQQITKPITLYHEPFSHKSSPQFLLLVDRDHTARLVALPAYVSKGVSFYSTSYYYDIDEVSSAIAAELDISKEQQAIIYYTAPQHGELVYQTSRGATTFCIPGGHRVWYAESLRKISRLPATKKIARVDPTPNRSIIVSWLCRIS